MNALMNWNSRLIGFWNWMTIHRVSGRLQCKWPQWHQKRIKPTWSRITELNIHTDGLQASADQSKGGVGGVIVMDSRIFCVPAPPPPSPPKNKSFSKSHNKVIENKPPNLYDKQINPQTPPKKIPISYVKAWLVHFVTLKHEINYCICVFQKIEYMTINIARAKKICIQNNSNWYLKRTWIYNAVIEQIYSVSIANFRANTPHTDWHSNLLISQVTFIIYSQYKVRADCMMSNLLNHLITINT